MGLGLGTFIKFDVRHGSKPWSLAAIYIDLQTNMNWHDLKTSIYYEDGSLRDIYIRNVTFNDWRRWVDFVNVNYSIDFRVGNASKANKIDFDVVASFWKKELEAEFISASIHLQNVIVNTYFFDQNEIENDITPTEMKTLEDHERLVDYLQKVSHLLSKPVELTEESYQGSNTVLLVVNRKQITFPQK